MASKNCVICGENSGMYPLCKKHMELKVKGLVIKNENGKWEEITEDFKNDSCLFCGKDSDGKTLCYSCFCETKDLKEDFNKNMLLGEMTDHYYNLRANIFRLNNFDYVIDNCKRLFSLAYLSYDIHKNSLLKDRVEMDVKDIVYKKTPVFEVQLDEKTEESDSIKLNIIRCMDGHLVKSDPERIIDDVLCNEKIFHCYEKDVIEVVERGMKCDWFIPGSIFRKGIYIEYWGMETASYKKNKKEKLELYKKYNVPLIEIQKEDVKEIVSLTSRILREIKDLNIRYNLGIII